MLCVEISLDERMHPGIITTPIKIQNVSITPKVPLGLLAAGPPILHPKQPRA